MQELMNLVLHMDQYLQAWIAAWGHWFYVVMFLVIFVETGVVVMPFLPGDSLLFAIGALMAVAPDTNPFVMAALLTIAAVLGDNVNFAIGHSVGEKAYQWPDRPWFKKAHLQQTHDFFEKYGSLTIVIARFAPFVRTFAPFVAGIAQMERKRFFIYNIVGGVLWINIFMWAGYYFGNIPAVKSRFHIVIFALIGISMLPVLYGLIKSRAGQLLKDSK